MSLFEKACRKKYRYTTCVGGCNTEDLFDLPLTSQKGPSLDDLARKLNKQIKDCSEESFVGNKSASNEVLEAKFTIVKRVIEIKLEEKAARVAASSKKGKREQILRLIADKENDVLVGKSLEELKALLD